MHNSNPRNELPSTEERQWRCNGDAMAIKRSRGNSEHSIHRVTAADKGGAPVWPRLSLNRLLRLVALQNTGMSSNCACQSFTRPKNTWQRLLRKKLETNRSKS